MFGDLNPRPILPVALMSSLLSRRGSTISGWSPLEITPSGWYDALLSAKVLSGVDIQSWTDLSVNGRHAVASATGLTYSDTDREIVFPGSKWFNLPSALVAAGNSPFTVAAVARVASAASGEPIIYGQGVASANQAPHVGARAISTSQFTLAFNNYSADAYASSSISGSLRTSHFILVATYTGDRKFMWVNGVQVVNVAYTAANTSTSTPRLGNGPFATNGAWIGGIRTVVAAQSAITDMVRQKLEGYLAHHWDLQSRLPSDHPYAATAP